MTATLTLYHHSTSVCSAKVRVLAQETYPDAVPLLRVDAVAATFGIAADIGGTLTDVVLRSSGRYSLTRRSRPTVISSKVRD